MPIGVALNSRPKYVASTSLKDPPWADTTVLTGDVATSIQDLRRQPGGYLLVPGSGDLVRWLLANELLDQLDLVVYPVVIGQGTRLFPDSGPDAALELVSSRPTSGGVVIQSYRPLGRRPHVRRCRPTELSGRPSALIADGGWARPALTRGRRRAAPAGTRSPSHPCP
jgi:dihydrofolate reductase